jgi:single-strand DNA-binding protein
MNYNKVILVGRLTADPELRYTATGSPICQFSLANNRSYKQGEEKKEETLFIDVTVWGRLGEQMAGTLCKGSSVLVEGRLRLDRWETAEGQPRSKHEVVAESIQYGDKRGDEHA